VGAEETAADRKAGRQPLVGRGAIVHDWFQGYHGSERVVDALRRGLFAGPTPPDIFTFEAAKELLPPDLAGAIVRESRVANMPGLRQVGHRPGRWRYLLPYMPYYFRRLDLDEYDVVISSTHACAHHVRPRRDATHVVYCHTPMRYVWMPETDERVAGLKGLGLRAATSHLRRLDRTAAASAGGYVANSTVVRERIRAFYGRDAVVIHPPVAIDELDHTREKDPGSFLWVNRLVSYKNPLLVAEAFRGLPYRLTMVGIGPLERKLRASLPPNVRLLGWLPRGELTALFASAAGFVHIGEEDFGISMVEALASGTPVIALDRGGARDIVRHGVDGYLIPEAELEPLRAAVGRLAGDRPDPAALAERARSFSEQRFVERMLDYVQSLR
jgi:glycosyltransferase involved in cell wall biosynthesis